MNTFESINKSSFLIQLFTCVPSDVTTGTSLNCVSERMFSLEDNLQSVVTYDVYTSNF